MYGFMLNVKKSNNLILNSIVHCDIGPIVHISSVETLDTAIVYIHPF